MMLNMILPFLLIFLVAKKTSSGICLSGGSSITLKSPTQTFDNKHILASTLLFVYEVVLPEGSPPATICFNFNSVPLDCRPISSSTSTSLDQTFELSTIPAGATHEVTASLHNNSYNNNASSEPPFVSAPFKFSISTPDLNCAPRSPKPQLFEYFKYLLEFIFGF